MRLALLLVLGLALGDASGSGVRAQETRLPRALAPAPWSTPELAGRIRERLGLEARRRDRNRRDSSTNINPTAGRADPVDAPLPSAGGGSFLAPLALAIVFIGGVCAVALFFARRREEETVGSKTQRITEETDWIERGDAALKEGRFAEALRAFYLHGVHLLRRAGLAPLAHHTTDGLIMMRLDRDDLRAAFSALSRRFHPVGYGRRPVDADATRAARADALKLEACLNEPEEDRDGAR